MCLPEVHIELGILFDNIALAYRCKNQFKECFKYYHRALDIKQRLQPLNLLSLAQTLSNIGAAYADRDVNNDQQDDAKAFEYFQRSISTHELNQSLRSPDLAITFYEKARLHEHRQEYQQAFDLLIQALNIQQAVLTRNHPDTFRTRDALIGLKIEL
ncbi:unnamed protein product [Rotaria sp. Silwood1]|nr:unnamed protein product [Rotaria sp. Silwood1]CAF5040055.1 unnamed protein product [Rotaria sp. Silwood1]